MKKKQLALLLPIILLLALMIPPGAQAVCPVCTVAVGAGLGISRWLGIDDVITGLWIGGLATSSGMWFSAWVGQKGVESKSLKFLAGLSFHFLLIPTLYLLKISGDPLNTLWGIDKIILGLILGAIAFFLSVITDHKIKAANDGQVLVYYQKVILPLLYLSILSFIFYLITN